MANAGCRRVGIAMDYSATSKTALGWAVNNLVESGDEIIIIHVVSPKTDHSSNKQLFEDTGSPLIPLEELREANVLKKYGLTHDAEAKVLAKIYWGDARDKLCEAVEHMKLDSLVIGSRGLGALKRVLLGSVSNYVVQNATCPVTVVKGAPVSKH
ncbi:universal stress protein PHOS34-like [Apium graveolens]|uniref:universal stress protein PHOS34-like n=1 Tax=Apium graveolens TaxID=4045 RepID=UPI003D7B12AC